MQTYAQTGLIPHDPVIITTTGSGENFTAVGGVTGTGMPNDPYVISGLEIVTNSSFGIHVRNTRSFFVIRDTLVQGVGFSGLSQGVLLDNVQNGIVDHLNVTGFTYGVQISAGSGNLVQNSNLWNNTDGIFVQSSNQLVRNNRLYNNTEYGASVQGATFNTFRNNNSSYNGNIINGAGFFISGSNNVFDHNFVSGNTWFGIKMVGSALQAASGNVFSNNTISLNGGTPDGGGICRCDGGGLVFANNATSNIIIGNYVANQDNGIGLETDAIGDYNNNLTLNRVIYNRFGLYIVEGSRNTVYNNYFNNTTNVLDTNVQNSWNITRTLRTNILGGPFQGGNFYSDYSGSDANGDGIGDTPYSTSDGHRLDFEPLMQNQPTVFHDVAALNLTASMSSARVGTTITITSRIFNQGTVAETFNVTLSKLGCSPGPCTQTVIGTRRLTNMPAFTLSTPTFLWNTTGLLPGIYSLGVKADTVTGELNTTNNQSPPTTVYMTINIPPTANFTITNAGPPAGNQVTLNGAPSHDPDGTITQYSWNFGDNTAATGQLVLHTWTTAGDYTVTLTVTDNEGARSSYTISVNVANTQPSTPQNFALIATSRSSVLAWTAPTNTGGSPITNYMIFRADSSSGPWVNIANTTTMGYTDTTVMDGQSYYYKVSATNQAGITSTPTASLNVLIPTAPTDNQPLFLTLLSITALIIGATILILLVFRKSRRSPS